MMKFKICRIFINIKIWRGVFIDIVYVSFFMFRNGLFVTRYRFVVEYGFFGVGRICFSFLFLGMGIYNLIFFKVVMI